jgi:hypothetical protein
VPKTSSGIGSGSEVSFRVASKIQNKISFTKLITKIRGEVRVKKDLTCCQKFKIFWVNTIEILFIALMIGFSVSHESYLTSLYLLLGFILVF